jgi:hypothetical protein
MEYLCVSPTVIPNASSQVWTAAAASGVQPVAEGAIPSKKKRAFLNFFWIACERIFQVLSSSDGESLSRKHTCDDKRHTAQNKREDRSSN